MKVIAIVSALFAAIAVAKKHHHCQCCVGSTVNEAVTQGACDAWVAIHPNSHWDGGACTDRGSGRGIDGDSWETQCRVYGSTNGFAWGDVRGCC